LYPSLPQNKFHSTAFAPFLLILYFLFATLYQIVMSERSIECGECKKPVKVVYKEVVGQTVTCTEMCDDCPILKAKLHGDAGTSKTIERSLCCGVCGTSLDSVKMGQPLGCAECYSVFAGYIISELVEAAGIPSSLKKKAQTQKLQTLHIGRSPQQPGSPALSSKLASLNEALNEALKKENYEQAARLRDQIKELTDKQ
jgi:protein arginine kinase activator